VVDRAGVLVFAGHLVDGRVDEELVDERRDLAVERRREQELLRVGSTRRRIRCIGSRKPSSLM
jgi:hypothetical protein